MRNDQNLKNLSYRGKGFFRFEDDSRKMSDLDVAKKVGSSLKKRVTHICMNRDGLINVHVLQYSHLHDKDQNRLVRKKTEKLQTKYS